MQLQDLPTEIFELILHHAMVARGVKRGVRLRLVNKLFARAVMPVLFSSRLLDHGNPGQRSENIHRYETVAIPVLSSYIAYRVWNEPSNGNHVLTCMKQVANEIYRYRDIHDAETSTPEDCLNTILPYIWVSGESLNGVMKMIFHRERPMTQVEYDKFLLGAALRTNCFFIIQRIIESLPQPLLPLSLKVFGMDYGFLFGQQFSSLAGNHSTKEVIALLLTAGAPIVNRKLRTRLFKEAAAAGRLEIVEFVYNYKREEVPWNFVDSTRNDGGSSYPSDEDQMLYWCLDTPSLEVAKFIEDLRSRNPNPNVGKWAHRYRREFYGAAGAGSVETAKYLIELGANPKGGLYDWFDTDGPIRSIAEQGHEELVEFLMPSAEFDYDSPWDSPGANPRTALAGAARTGRTELVRKLLKLPKIISHNTVDYGLEDGFECLYEATRLGYVGVVILLLDAGMDPNTRGDYYWEFPLVGAVKAEHTALFRLLMERGADLSLAGEYCIHRAKKDGLESMLELLREYGLDC